MSLISSLRNNLSRFLTWAGYNVEGWRSDTSMANHLLPESQGEGMRKHHDFILSCVSYRREIHDARGCEQYKDR